MKRFIKWLVVLAVVVVFGAPLTASRTPVGELVRNIPLGWIAFLKRHVAEMTINWVMVATAILLAGLLLVASQGLMKSLHRQIQQRHDSNAPVRPWPWRWTLALFACLGLLFLVAFGATGMMRQTSWLIHYPNPWHEVRRNPISELKQLGVQIILMAEEKDNDIDAIKCELGQMPWLIGRTPIFEHYQVILFAKPDRTYGGYIIVPRTPMLLRYGKFSSSATPEMIQPLSELESTVQKLSARYPVQL